MGFFVYKWVQFPLQIHWSFFQLIRLIHNSCRLLNYFMFVDDIIKIQDKSIDQCPNWEQVALKKDIMNPYIDQMDMDYLTSIRGEGPMNLDVSTPKKYKAHLEKFRWLVPYLRIKSDIISRDGMCMICGTLFDGQKINFQLDHIIPRKYLSCSHPFNIQLACTLCNYEKSDQILDSIPIFLIGAVERTNMIYNSNEKYLNQFIDDADRVYKTQTPKDSGKLINTTLLNYDSWSNIQDYLIILNHI